VIEESPLYLWADDVLETYASFRAEIAQLKAERDRLRDALRPFAELADKADPDDGDGVEINHATVGDCVTLRECRIARAALKGDTP
jgi:hypothetical protein